MTKHPYRVSHVFKREKHGIQRFKKKSNQQTRKRKLKWYKKYVLKILRPYQ